MTKTFAFATALVAIVATCVPAHAQSSGVAFADVQAIFSERCTLCHSGDQAPVGLSLVDYDRVMAGSDRGPVVVPGDPAASELVRRIRGTSTPRMPLTGPPFLSDAQIETIAAWVANGAPGPASDAEGDGAPDAGAPAAAQQNAPAEPGTFAHVQSILVQRCARCHSVDGVMGAPPEGFVVTSYDAVLAGGDRVVVVPGAPAASELLRRVEGRSLPRMPFDGPPFLESEQIESIRTWIERGAPDADGRAADVPVGAEVRLGGVLTGRWVLDGLVLQTTGETRFDDDPTAGSRVEVRGVVTEDGGVRATRIRVR